MRGTYGLLAAGAAAYLAALVALFPADRALDWGAKVGKEAGLRLSGEGVTGTVWRGSAVNLFVNGIPLGATEWEVSPWRLLTGSIGLHWRVKPGGGSIEGDARVAMGSVSLSGVEGHLPAPAVTDLARLPAMIEVEGDLSLRVEEFTRADGKLEALTGTLLWHRAAVARPARFQLGDLKVLLQKGSAGQVVGKLQDGGGPLALSGTITLGQEGSYRLDMTLASRADADPALAQALPFVGRPDGKGGYVVTWSGRFTR